jgi:hypothetical protein
VHSQRLSLQANRPQVLRLRNSNYSEGEIFFAQNVKAVIGTTNGKSLLFAALLISISFAADAGIIKTGSFAKSTTTGNQVVAHGLGLTPKALIFWTTGRNNESFGTSFHYSFGATDGTNSRCSSAASQNSQGTSDASRRIAVAAITIVEWDEDLIAEAQFSSWDATNFTLNWTTNNNQAYIVHFVAIGGNDVQASVVGWTMPTSTGDFSVTGTGFQPDVVIHSHVGSGYTTTVGTSAQHAAIATGFMDVEGDVSSSEILIVDGVGTSDTQRNQSTVACFTAINNGLGVTKQASLASMDADGFTLNFNIANTNAARAFSIAFKGLNSHTGSFNKTTSAAPASQTVTGIGFTPTFLMFSSFMDTAEATPVAEGRYGIGASDGTTEGSSTFQDTNGLGTTSVDSIDKTSKIFVKVDNNTPTINAEADFTSFNSDGFTVNWTTNDNVATQIVYFVLAPLAPTKVSLKSFEAFQSGSQVQLRWRTGYEIDNLGFSVYREINGDEQKLNSSIIAGTAMITGASKPVQAGWSYSWNDSLSKNSSSVKYWLEDIDLNGNRTRHGPVFPQSVDALSESRNVPLLNQISRIGSFTKSILKTNFASAKDLKKQKQIAASNAIKIYVKDDGWYRVSQPQLIAAGLDPDVNPRKLQLYLNGKQQAILVTGQNDGTFDPQDAIEFYGSGLDQPYSDQQVYWLLAGSMPGKRIKSASGTGAASPGPANFPQKVERKDRTIYFAALKNGDVENFFGSLVNSTPLDQTLQLSNLDSAATSEALLEISLQGVTDNPDSTSDHTVVVSINNNALSPIVFDGQALMKQQFSIPHSWLIEGQNTVTLTAQGGAQDVSLVESIRITYEHTYTADGDVLFCTFAGKGEIRIEGFSDPQIRLFDITKSNNVREISGTVIPEGPTFTIIASLKKGGERTILALTENTISDPSTLKLNIPSSWHDEANGADALYLTHSDFVGQVTSLQQLRESQGTSVELIDVEDIYDEFSFGVPNPLAIKNFLNVANSEWVSPPHSVLLAGDASFDPRNYLGFGDFDFVPTGMVATNSGETASDDWFVDFDDDLRPEMTVGRIPSRTSQEASSMINKIIQYEQTPAGGSWSDEIMMVADNNDLVDFESASLDLTALIPQTFTITNVFLGQSDPSTARSQILNGIENGKRIVHYLGHGSVEVWAEEDLLTSTDAEAFANGLRLPLVVALNCLNGYFHDVFTNSLAEAFLRNPNGGAVAVWASSGFTETSRQTSMDSAFLQSLFNQNEPLTLGEAIFRAKQNPIEADVSRTWILFGDPLSRIYP